MHMYNSPQIKISLSSPYWEKKKKKKILKRGSKCAYYINNIEEGLSLQNAELLPDSLQFRKLTKTIRIWNRNEN